MRGRSRRAPPEPGYGRARTRHRSRPPAEQLADERQTAEEVVQDPDDWEPRRNDLAGVDTGPDYGRRTGEGELEAAERQATTAPVHGDPTLDPVTSIHDVANMAGYGDGAGYDALDGVDDMVMGRVDATREMKVESNTPGQPLQMGRRESVYSDDDGAGTHSTGLATDEDPRNVSWTDELGTDDADGMFGGSFDWEGWL